MAFTDPVMLSKFLGLTKYINLLLHDEFLKIKWSKLASHKWDTSIKHLNIGSFLLALALSFCK